MDVDRTPSLEDQVAELSGFDHRLYFVEDFHSSYIDGNVYEVDQPSAANVISSEIVTSVSDKHSFAVDIDMPARLVPSSTPGHFHLYIDCEMDWADYLKALRALAAAGILQAGYVDACEERGWTSLRLPWIKKDNA